VPRETSYNGSDTALPLSVQRASEVDWGFRDRAACRPGPNSVQGAWFAIPNKKYRIGGSLYSGDKLLEMALTVCRSCDAQWSCAAAAIYVEEPIGTWGDTHKNLTWLSKSKHWRTHLEMAESAGVPVQDLISMLQAKKGTIPR